MQPANNNHFDQLLAHAREACANSYSPYSSFPVGAAVLCESGSIYKGTNVENASYGLTICAERSAICTAISAGEKKIKAIAIYAPVSSIPPCGACRQFILEFGGDIAVVFEFNGQRVETTAAGLLPMGFTNSEL